MLLHFAINVFFQLVMFVFKHLCFFFIIKVIKFQIFSYWNRISGSSWKEEQEFEKSKFNLVKCIFKMLKINDRERKSKGTKQNIG